MADPAKDMGAPARPIPSRRGILSAAEIEALLRPDLSDLEEAAPPPALTAPLAPASFEAEGEPADGARWAARITLALRGEAGLEAAARGGHARRRPFAEAADTLPDGAAVFFGRGRLVQGVLALDRQSAARLIDQACGGLDVAAAPRARALTAVDAAILRALMRPVVEAVAPDAEILRIETTKAYVRALAPPGPATVIDFELTVQQASGAAVLIVADPPDEAAASPSADGAASGGKLSAALVARIASLSVPVSRLSDLKPGDTLLLGVPPDQPVALLSGDRDGPLAAEGEIGRKGGKIAVRISRRGPALR